jgi:GT2 family glycosyltransferase
MEPAVTVVILNYNGRKHLGEDLLSRCVSSVLQSNYDNLELLFVDNGSTDGSVKFIKKCLDGSSRKTKVLAYSKNYGYGVGNNLAIGQASGEYVALLNNDVEVDPNWILELVQTMKSDSTIGIAQSKVLSLDRTTIQSVGNLLDTSLMTYCIGQGQKDVGQYEKPCEITYAFGTAHVVRRSLIEEIGLFDPNYFFYHDDCDLGWRARLAGYKVISVPSSVVYHRAHGTSKNTFGKAKDSQLLFISRIGLLIKNLECRNVWKFGARLLLSIGMDLLGLTWQGDTRTAISVISWAFKNFRKNWKSRVSLQTQVRKISDDEVLKYFLDSSILVFRIKRQLERLTGGSLYRDVEKLANQKADDYYKNHTYSH